MPFDPNMMCFACMKQLNEKDGICPHCGYDNHNRQNTGQQLPFSVIGGKYLIGKCLGQGGFGITYLGYDITLNRRVAIKEYFPNNVAMRTAGSSELSTQGMEQRADFMTGISKFIAEAQMLVALDEIPNTVRVFDAFLANSTAYIVMDYVEGQTLSQYLDAHGGKLSMKEAMKLFTPLIDSLAALHSENIIHRDLKPANLMLRAKDGQLILLDFGAARTYLDNANGMTTFHTNGYSPKEQYVRNGLQDGRTDEYALCATIYRTITGKNPPTSVERQLHEDTIIPPSKYCKDITPKQEAALLKGISLEINDRYPNLMQLKEALQSEQEEARVEKTADTPKQAEPEQKTPEQKTPAQKTPVQETPVQEPPAKEPPAQETPVQQTPEQKTPTQDKPVQWKPAIEWLTPEYAKNSKPKRPVFLYVLAGAIAVFMLVVLTSNSKQGAKTVQSNHTVVETNAAVATNAPAANVSRTFELSSTITLRNGRVTVRWTDSASCSPYRVSYQQIASGDAIIPFFWAGSNESGSTTSSKSFTIDVLAPGKTYRIRIRDCNNETIYYTYTIPEAPTFEDGKLSATSFKISITPTSKAVTDSDKDAKSCGTLKSATIQSDMGSKDYGIEYHAKYPSLAHSRTYFTQIIITSPDGFTICENSKDVTFEQRYVGITWNMVGSRTFAKYYENNNKIIPGEWTVELYFDGKFVNRSTFNVS